MVNLTQKLKNSLSAVKIDIPKQIQKENMR